MTKQGRTTPPKAKQSCGWCGSADTSGIRRFKRGSSFAQLFESIAMDLLNQLVDSRVYPLEQVAGCPKCHDYRLTTIAILNPKYQCNGCGFVFTKPAPISTCHPTQGDLDDFFVKYKPSIQREVRKIQQAQ